MDATQFLKVVLPSQGHYCVGMLQNKQFSNFWYGTPEEIIEASKRISLKLNEAYFALSSFKDKTTGRKQVNVQAVRSFWLDIDTQESKPRERYASRKVAMVELEKFRDELGLPKPYVISSGYGLHVYWPCDEDMDGATWQRTALKLKAATVKWGLAVDPSRTSDSASVLRTPDTSNYKNGGEKKVLIIQEGEAASREYLHSMLSGYVGDTVDEVEDELGAAPDFAAQGTNSDLSDGVGFAPSDPEKVAKHCGIVGMVRDTRGDVDQPTWYNVLSVVRLTTGGDALCHEWSKGHAEYTAGETNAKLAQLDPHGPAYCTTLEQFHPEKCDVCPSKGKIKSPIVLGRVGGEPQFIEGAPDIMLDAIQTKSGVPEFPNGYGWADVNKNGKKVLFYTEVKQVTDDATGQSHSVNVHVPFSDVLFYPTARVSTKTATDEIFGMMLYMKTQAGEERSFPIDTSLVAEGGSKLRTYLGGRELNAGQSTKGGVDQYLNAWMGKLRDEYNKTPNIRQFGWHEGNFVIGTELITPEGPRKAVVAREGQLVASRLQPMGSFDVWADTIDKLYNHEGDESLQFCVLASFAAPLISMCVPQGGVTIHAYSAGTGFGKSTAQMAGLSAWGDGGRLMLKDFTELALYQYMGMLKNLPVVIDELTNAPPAFASQLVYSTSGGKGRMKMNSDSVIREEMNWSTLSIVSGNTQLTDKVSVHRANAEAEISRIWEFRIENRSSMNPNEALELIPLLDTNHGHAGRMYAQYLVTHREKVQAMVQSMRTSFNTRANITQGERYWSILHASSLTALAICNKLGILKFDFETMLAWIMRQLEANRGQLNQSVTKPVEQFAAMLAEIWNGVLVTRGEGVLLQGIEARVEKDPQGPITGRSIIENKETRHGEKLYIAVSVAKEWCSKKGVSFSEMHAALVNAGACATEMRRISLGKGTIRYGALSGPVKCLDINPSAVRALTGVDPMAATLTPVSSVGGFNGQSDVDIAASMRR